MKKYNIRANHCFVWMLSGLLNLAFCTAVFAQAVPYDVRYDDVQYEPEIIPHANADGSVTVAWRVKDSKTNKVSTYSGSNWSNASHVTINAPMALGYVAGMVQDDAGNTYVLTAAKENANRSDWGPGNPQRDASGKFLWGKGAYRPNVLNILKIAKGSNSATIFADMNSEKYSSFTIFNPVGGQTPDFAYTNNTLALAVPHSWAWDDYDENGNGHPLGFHQRHALLAMGTAAGKPALYRENGSNAHNAGNRITAGNRGFFNAGANEGGVWVSKLTEKPISEWRYFLVDQPTTEVPGNVVEELLLSNTLPAGCHSTKHGDIYTPKVDLNFTTQGLSDGVFWKPNYNTDCSFNSMGGGPGYKTKDFSAFQSYLSNNKENVWGDNFKVAAAKLKIKRVKRQAQHALGQLEWSEPRHIFHADPMGNDRRTRLGGVGTGSSNYVVAFVYGVPGGNLWSDDWPTDRLNVYLAHSISHNFKKDDGKAPHINLTPGYAGENASARRLKLVNLQRTSGLQHFAMVWEKWKDGKYNSTWGVTINEIGGHGGAWQIPGNPRIQDGADGVLIKKDGKRYVAWVTGDQDAKKLVLHTLEVDARDNAVASSYQSHSLAIN